MKTSVFTWILAEQMHFLTGEHKALQTNESGIPPFLAREAWQGWSKKSVG